MHITQQTLSLKANYDHQQESVRKQEVLPTLAKADQQDVNVEVSLQQRNAVGISLSRRDLQKAAEQNRQQQQQQTKPTISLPPVNVASPKHILDATTVTTAAIEATGANSSQKTSDELSDEDLSLDAHTRLMKTVIESLFGIKVKLMPPIRQTNTDETPSTDPAALAAQQTPTEPDHQVRITEYTSESETLSFSASGEVKTADGRTIKLKLGFGLSYKDMTLSERLTKQSALKDPLVINLESQFADLNEARFNFDIDSDGTKDSLPSLGSGSYFLALDKNSNKQIDDGKELFGAQSGNGFAELAQYDEDGNSFIDEGDSIYGLLSVWRPGKGLQALAQVGVGAIYLHPVETQFQNMGNSVSNESLGVLRSSGVYINENGSAGTVQQLDLRA